MSGLTLILPRQDEGSFLKTNPGQFLQSFSGDLMETLTIQQILSGYSLTGRSSWGIAVEWNGEWGMGNGVTGVEQTLRRAEDR